MKYTIFRGDVLSLTYRLPPDTNKVCFQLKEIYRYTFTNLIIFSFLHNAMKGITYYIGLPILDFFKFCLYSGSEKGKYITLTN